MRLTYTRAALKDVKKVNDKKLKEKLKAVLIDLKKVQNLKDFKGLKKMAGHPAAYRIRIGNYRLGFYFENDLVEIARFLKREDIYKVFPK